MIFTPISLGLALLPFVIAAVHDVQVGNADGKLEYSPEAIGAQPGDQVVFHFNPKNHTVSQSSFANPCGLKDGGFDSGFMPVPANQTDNLPTFTITINDTQPVWVYCRQLAKQAGSHCGAGMVFAVNCPADGSPNSFANFKQAALAIGASLSSAAAAASTPASPAPLTTAAPQVTPVTQTVTLGSQVWTTTYDSSPGSPSPTASGTVHTVTVGEGSQLAFNPTFVMAQPLDQIVFQFQSKNHSVTQSSFADPCHKLDNGFDSGFQPVANGSSQFPTFTITVNDTNPLWVYCRQTTPLSHCGTGMVFAVNPVQSSDHNFTAFQNAAKTLNGTAASQSAVPATTGTSPNGAVSVHVGSASIVIAGVALLASFL